MTALDFLWISLGIAVLAVGLTLAYAVYTEAKDGRPCR